MVNMSGQIYQKKMLLGEMITHLQFLGLLPYFGSALR